MAPTPLTDITHSSAPAGPCTFQGSQQPCQDASSSCRWHFDPIPLAEAMDRFQREAVHGICDTGRYRCPYFTWGTGPVLVCVPGLIDDSTSFVPLLANLSRHFRCVAYDWPTGNGDGAHLPLYHHADFVADLLAVLDAVGADEAVPLGYSFGSTVTLAALNSHPRRFNRAVLLSGFAHRKLAPAERLLASLARWWNGPMRYLPLRNWILHQNMRGAFSPDDPAMWDFYVQRSGEMAMPPVAHRALILDHVDVRRLLPAIRQQVLLVCGDADPLVNQQCETELLMGLPNVRRVELKHCGHAAIFTHAALLAELIGEFFTS